MPQEYRSTAEDAGKRLDQFLVTHLPEISRVRVQQLIEQQIILVNGLQAKPSFRLRGGELRPGIVHRLDKETSGLMVVAKNDIGHRRLAEQFSRRQVKKQYIALVHGWMKEDRGTVNASISRDQVRRTRMTTRRSGGR